MYQEHSNKISIPAQSKIVGVNLVWAASPNEYPPWVDGRVASLEGRSVSFWLWTFVLALCFSISHFPLDHMSAHMDWFTSFVVVISRLS